MNINSVNYNNNTTFNAKFKIERTKTYKPIDEWIDKWISEKEKEWAIKAWSIGTRKDTITIKIGKNDIGKRDYFRKQNMSATSKINGIKIHSDDLKFKYDKPIGNSGSTEYCYTFEDRINDYLDFLKRLGNATIYKK